LRFDPPVRARLAARDRSRRVKQPLHVLAVLVAVTASLLAGCKKGEGGEGPLCQRGQPGFCACGGDWPQEVPECSVSSIGGGAAICCRDKDECECSDAICTQDLNGCHCSSTIIYGDDPTKHRVPTCKRGEWQICCSVRSSSGGAGRPCYCLNATHCPFPTDEVVEDCTTARAAVCETGEPVERCR
jgi:hypothetical protein